MASFVEGERNKIKKISQRIRISFLPGRNGVRRERVEFDQHLFHRFEVEQKRLFPDRVHQARRLGLGARKRQSHGVTRVFTDRSIKSLRERHDRPRAVLSSSVVAARWYPRRLLRDTSGGRVPTMVATGN